MSARLLVLLSLLLVFCSCAQEQVYFPEGDVQAGKQLFKQLQCYGCHEVRGEDYPKPSAITPTYVSLGASNGKRQRCDLIEAIVAPSHRFAVPNPPEGQPVEEISIKVGSKSRMTDFCDRITVKELLDLVAYLQELESKPPPEVAGL